ncbi:stage II sporulation protein E, partial [bacterium]|nr:stage II sporulation protein E [bacterium]
MFIDIDCFQQRKYNQNAFGDYFTSTRYPKTGRIVAVLSDGLGSGVKANILACMTATMLLKFIEEGTGIKKSCETIMNSLP